VLSKFIDENREGDSPLSDDVDESPTVAVGEKMVTMESG